MEQESRQYVQSLLTALRAAAHRRFAESDRLPAWMRAAKITIGVISETAVFLFEDSPGNDDEIVFRGAILSDCDIYFGRSGEISRGAIPIRIAYPGCRFMGSYSDPALPAPPAILNFPTTTCFAYPETSAPHGPLIIGNMLLQHYNGDKDATVAVRLISLAIYNHRCALTEAIPQDTLDEILRDVEVVYISARGEQNSARRRAHRAVSVLKERTVIVLGSYRPELLAELESVRDRLRLQFDAHLLIDFPSPAGMTNDQKLRLWTNPARFCVMINRRDGASGHLAEYPVLRDQQSVVAMLQPKEGGASAMIGQDESPFIRIFQFDDSPFEVLDRAVTWAEEYVAGREVRHPGTI